MARALFANFLNQGDEYRACEEYWRELVERVANSAGQGNEWRPWIDRYRPDGSPVEQDGNPIYDVRSVTVNRAVRIIQYVCSGADVEIAAWVKTYELEFVDLPSEELIINLCLSEESAELAAQLLSKWMDPTTQLESMQQFINKLL
jgi:hypothetical protein